MAKKEFKVLRGSVELKGVIRGLDRQVAGDKNFFDKEYDSGTKYRELAFNVESAPGESTRVRIKEIKQEKVFVFGEEGVMKELPWKERNDLPQGFRSMNTVGFHSATETKKDGTRLTVYKHGYDAIKEICANYKDGDTVYIRGGLEHNDYSGDTYTNATLARMYFSKDEINFQSEDFDIDEFVPKRQFTQYVVFESYDKDDDSGKHLINTRVITRKTGDNAKVVFEINPKFVPNFKKVKEGTEMYLIGDYYTTPKSGIVDMDEQREDDEYGFADTEGYAESAEEVMAVRGVDVHLVVEVVLNKDNEGNKYIKTGEYDMDELDQVKADILAEREEKNDAKKSGAKNKKRNKGNKKETDWSGLKDAKEDNSKESKKESKEEPKGEPEDDDGDWD